MVWSRLGDMPLSKPKAKFIDIYVSHSTSNKSPQQMITCLWLNEYRHTLVIKKLHKLRPQSYTQRWCFAMRSCSLLRFVFAGNVHRCNHNIALMPGKQLEEYGPWGFSDVNPYTLLNKLSRGRRSQTPWWSCDIFVLSRIDWHKMHPKRLLFHCVIFENIHPLVQCHCMSVWIVGNSMVNR